MGGVDREAATRAIEAFLIALGRDPAREPELMGTARRVTDTYVDDLCAGYGVDPALALRPHVVKGATSVVALSGIHVTTMCPHHLMPATGLASVAFAPRDRLLGLGAIVKLVDIYALRLTLQEEIGEGVVTTLFAELEPRWAICRLNLDHACVIARGERRHGTKALTVAFRGDEADRAEAILVTRSGA
jgi:GTP cyclohydrolase IA